MDNGIKGQSSVAENTLNTFKKMEKFKHKYTKDNLLRTFTMEEAKLKLERKISSKEYFNLVCLDHPDHKSMCFFYISNLNLDE